MHIIIIPLQCPIMIRTDIIMSVQSHCEIQRIKTAQYLNTGVDVK